MSALFEALTLQSGYNAALVTIGAALLGISAGATGTFLYLRKRALVSDAVAHATLPGVGIAFMIMVAFGLDGRSLIGLLVGSAISAGLGLLAVDWITRKTRLSEDAAIGAVLSVFFGFGIVLLTIIQTMSAGRQAGLEGFLLGSTAGMLRADAVVIAVGGGLSLLALIALRRPMTLVTFDESYAQSTGVNIRRIDLAMMGLVMAVTVIGLKLVGLILVVAMLIIPSATARFWTNRTEGVVWIAGAIGGLSGWIGAAISASAPDLPTGPIIVLVAAGVFILSMVFAPGRGVVSALLRHRSFQHRVHLRQGLLALAHGEKIYDPLTLKVLSRERLIRPDGVATDEGRAVAAKALLDERRYAIARRARPEEAQSGLLDGLKPISEVLTRDELKAIDAELGPVT